MSKPLRLSVVDQSPVRAGGTGAAALRETVELAILAEQWGYQRYWVSEHHNAREFAATSPLILAGQIAARTSTIRVGSGGVLLSNYSALQVAESYRVLTSLYPGRIDLGLGRAPGGDRRTTAALATTARNEHHYAEKLDDLLSFLSPDAYPSTRFSGINPGPTPGQERDMPAIWLLGSGTESAELAARRGLPLSLAHVGSPSGPAIVERYRQTFRPSPLHAEPHVTIAASVVCAETDERAQHLAWSLWFMRLRNAHGQTGAIETPEHACAHITACDMTFIEQTPQSDIVGDPQQVKNSLEEIAAIYRVDDVSIITICHDHADRVRSYELIATAFSAYASRPTFRDALISGKPIISPPLLRAPAVESQ